LGERLERRRADAASMIEKAEWTCNDEVTRHKRRELVQRF